MNDQNRTQFDQDQSSNDNLHNEEDSLYQKKYATFVRNSFIGMKPQQISSDMIANLEAQNLIQVKFKHQSILLDHWILLYEDQNFKIIYKSINQQSILLIYKQFLVQDLDTQTFLMNLIMSIIDSCSFFFFIGEMNQSQKLNKFVRKDTKVLKFYQLFQKLDQDNKNNIILEYQINCFSPQILIKKFIDNAFNEINSIDRLLIKYYNLIKNIKSDENNHQFDTIISDFMQELKAI
ncbi:unnamed protein product [Paramecium pentaurelia]|uniref:Uncharacterized protein n=1 Tax=Paramecium pentaurelia TaxID=43138 RepID=A0A8S1VGY3_9CILI|nr:unnamed protein product [Paramecium pentaurelia]